MRQRILNLCVAVLIGLAAAGCGTNRAAPVTPTFILPATTAGSQTPTGIAPSAIPSRVVAPVITVVPDLTALLTTVEMANFRFAPSTIKARAGQPIRLELKNTDALRHNFAIDNSDIEAFAAPGFSQRLDFVIGKPGTYIFVCNITDEGDHRAAGMMGTIIVEPAP